jgi:glycosidase
MGCAGTHAFLAEWAAYLHGIAPEAWTVGEAWGNLDAVMPYYPDQLTSYFGFEIADSIVQAVRRGSSGGMLSGYLRLQDTLPQYRYSPFLSNHDGTRVMTLLHGDTARMREAATLLLTLPGVPFVYYGEEIGMLGSKPDPMLRTPMQWAPRPGYGFTTSSPWEPAQSDSMTTTVAAQDRDPGSLLNLYRRLIHLRRDNDALVAGILIPLTGGGDQVIGYLRKASGRSVVLVVGNLGDMPVTDVSLQAQAGALRPGTPSTRDLLGSTRSRMRIEQVPSGSLAIHLSETVAPHQILVLEVKN